MLFSEHDKNLIWWLLLLDFSFDIFEFLITPMFTLVAKKPYILDLKIFLYLNQREIVLIIGTSTDMLKLRFYTLIYIFIQILIVN